MGRGRCEIERKKSVIDGQRPIFGVITVSRGGSSMALGRCRRAWCCWGFMGLVYAVAISVSRRLGYWLKTKIKQMTNRYNSLFCFYIIL